MRKKFYTVVALCLSALLLFGCNNSTKDSPSKDNDKNNSQNNLVNNTGLTGEELAKLLLADERLDTSILKGSNDLFEAKTAANHLFSSEFISCLKSPINMVNGTCTVTGNTYEWSNFTEYSNIGSFFDSYETNISGTVEAACSIIDIIKTDANITDKWIKYNEDDLTRYMLLVDGNSETLIEDNELAIRICKRYTNDAAQNVYEVFQTEKTYSFEYYFKYIPGVSYEFLISDNGEIRDCLTGVNNGGNWNLFCIGDMGTHCNVSYVMTGNEVSYIFDYSITDDSLQRGILSIASAGLTSDVISIVDDKITIYPNSFSGIQCLRVVTDNVTSDINNLDADILFWEGMYSTMGVTPSIVLSNGNVIEFVDLSSFTTAEEHEAVENTVYYWYGNVAPLGDAYRPELSFHVPGNNITEMLGNFKNYLSSNGINCKYSLDTIIAYAPQGSALLNQFPNTHTINGYTINSYTSAHAGLAAYATIFNTYNGIYETVKDYDSVLINKEEFLAENYDFTSIENITSGTVGLADNTLSIDGLSLTLNNLYLIDAGCSYTVKIAFAVKNENGQYDPCQLMTLSSDEEDFTTYESGDTFTLTQSAGYLLDCELFSGNYDIIGYISTDNDIRVSEFFPITSSDAAGTTYEFDTTAITVNDDGTMTASYVFNYNITYEVDTTEATYTYQDIHDAFICMISDYGTASGVVEQLNADGTYSEYSLGDAPNNCTLRMAYTYDDNGTEATAYCTIILTGK